jgi:hypothetical protein
MLSGLKKMDLERYKLKNKRLYFPQERVQTFYANNIGADKKFERIERGTNAKQITR